MGHVETRRNSIHSDVELLTICKLTIFITMGSVNMKTTNLNESQFNFLNARLIRAANNLKTANDIERHEKDV